MLYAYIWNIICTYIYIYIIRTYARMILWLHSPSWPPGSFWPKASEKSWQRVAERTKKTGKKRSWGKSGLASLSCREFELINYPSWNWNWYGTLPKIWEVGQLSCFHLRHGATWKVLTCMINEGYEDFWVTVHRGYTTNRGPGTWALPAGSLIHLYRVSDTRDHFASHQCQGLEVEGWFIRYSDVQIAVVQED